ncbi:MAG: MgtC/SapB family protein [Nitrospinaceae bacterium]|nr:MgtC/SapB family protein [Nitrospinaceae bacterium]NIR55577.1 MgtC/SapB family protein [Nitrospinaceae bacterium]NIS86011.1 MgtC/SapB family protein [Nitrospinaceae bacterium]NIT82857.1 MgtC/SapB family protein [Nitrospinaceae bacterium]NIU45059.1 MgtC/SapB family protein [Nitrospinaceae bacterium]
MDLEFSWLIDSSILFRLVLAILLGGVVGLEREMHGRPAGFRTHIVVCLGATMMIVGSEFYQAQINPGTVFDPNRMAAGIITGIGFLGAGAIMREENVVRGLTTAGCVWFVAGLGIVIGKGLLALALWSTLLVFVMLVFFRYVETWMAVEMFAEITVQMALDNFETIKNQCAEIMRQKDFRVEEKSYRVDNQSSEIEVKYTLIHQKGKDQEDLLLQISRLEGVRRVSG